MLKDIFRRKEIDTKAQLIAATIVASYPLEVDMQRTAREKAGSEAEQKLINAIGKGRVQLVDTYKAMNLGFLGKAMLCKSIQSKLLELGYSMDTVISIIEKLAVAERVT